jgi:Domain of unknown function (DUF5134)
MTRQPWLAATFAAIMIGTAGYCLTRLAVSWRRKRPTDRRVDGMHVLMGVAMAGMLVPQLRLLWAGGWEIIFACLAALFGYRIARAARGHSAASRWRSHDAQHLLGCAAMLYMLVLVAPLATTRTSSAAPGMLAYSAPDSAVPLMLAVALLGCVVWTADRMSSMARVAQLTTGQSQVTAGLAPLSPRLSACCEIATGVTMGYMLIMMLT